MVIIGPRPVVVDHGFKTQLGQIKDNKIGVYCFSAKHVALRSKGKDWNQDNVSESASL